MTIVNVVIVSTAYPRRIVLSHSKYIAYPRRIILKVGEGGPVLAEQLLGRGGDVLPMARATRARHHRDLEVEVRHSLAHTAAEGARLLRERLRVRARVRLRVRDVGQGQGFGFASGFGSGSGFGLGSGFGFLGQGQGSGPGQGSGGGPGCRLGSGSGRRGRVRVGVRGHASNSYRRSCSAGGRAPAAPTVCSSSATLVP